ncbi:hypothetical protein Sked_31630 [Sanguibacter keddieii DSM 10542]|uniref:DUF3263 domain-containing protein n=1 Tax=Sanguibacter keddieii (strain ATCC 51767 / DSM 10542 / NCFB 3025 / ST-74) TaxID=446469 RepID=D1BD56_SANKS|nr:DUF3263 domain-containing protein [Sanguibacter keddieii]ACZ23060.1 hypothetical protein Sked_31630 [Sanguibacter keddieii DSM 10542]
MIEAVPDIDETTDGATGAAVTSPGSEQPSTAGAEPTTDEQPTHPGLTERDAAVLDFEKQWWKYAGAKEQAVRELFGLSATQYYQVLNTLIDSPAALAAEPMLVKRLRRMRASRQRERTQRRSQV